MDNTPCRCNLKCFEAVPEARRERLFEGFWRSADFNAQNAYICGCVKVVEVAKRYVESGAASRRTSSRVYYVKNGRVSTRVCKVAFLRIHAISNGRLDRALKAQSESGGSLHNDQRGSHPPPNKTTEESLAFVKEQISTFPKYKSHYSRSSNPNRHYLSPDLTINKMYYLYRELCSTQGQNPVSEWVYRQVFNKEFNLSFGRYVNVMHYPCTHADKHMHMLAHTHPRPPPPHTHTYTYTHTCTHMHTVSHCPILFSSSPKTDTCKTCDTFKVQTDAERDEATLTQLRGEWELHLCKAERAYQDLKEDSALAKSDPDVLVLTFDLQQSLPTPVLTTNVVFYKRQLWTYNLGIHNCGTESGHMHLWHERMASRGSHDIASCLLKYLKNTSPTATHLITYSDSCGGQNRNVYLLSMWLHIVASDEFAITVVDQKFMTVGHSYLPNDRDFGSIETERRKRNTVFVPDEWAELILKARRKNPFTVTKMTPADFVSLVLVSKAFVNRKINTAKRSVQWLQIKWIRVQKDKPLQFQYRYSLNDLEAWKTVDLKRRTKDRPPDLGRIQLPRMYTTARPIKPAKKTDLLSLFQYIPPLHHPFYNNLLATDGNNEGSEQSDDENSDKEEDERVDSDVDGERVEREDSNFESD